MWKVFACGFSKGEWKMIDTEKIKELIDEIENAQEDCGNLDWISKEQAIKIIKECLK